MIRALLTVGERVEVYDADERAWFPGTIDAIEPIGFMAQPCYVVKIDDPRDLTRHLNVLTPRGEQAVAQGTQLSLMAVPVNASAGVVRKI